MDMIQTSLSSKIDQIDVTAVALVGILAVIAFSLWRLQRNKTVEFDLLDLLMHNGKVSKGACVMMGAFAITSWIMVRLTLNDALTEGYMGLYMGAWVTPVIAGVVFGKKDAKTENEDGL